MVNELALLLAISIGYVICIPLAHFPIAPVVIDLGILVALIVGKAADKIHAMLIAAAATVGYVIATTAVGFPTWPLAFLAVGLVAYIIIKAKQGGAPT